MNSDQFENNCVRGRAGRPARPRTQHDCHHDTNVKPEAATAVIELLMMDGKTPETCLAVNRRQDNKLKNCCIRLGDLFELNVKLWCQNVKSSDAYKSAFQQVA